MPVDEIVALLITERDKLNRAIDALGAPGPRRRGRPPKSASLGGGGGIATPLRKRRPRRSAAARKAQSKRMKAYWAAKRKETKA